MLILGIDTATPWGTIALCDENDCLFEVSLKSGKGGGEYLLSILDLLFLKAGKSFNELSLVATGTGPGSYTGIRVGIAAVQGLAIGLKVPVFGVSTLRIIAENGVWANDWVAAVIDARRGAVYAALFQNSNAGLNEVIAPHYTQIENFLEEIVDLSEVLICGDGGKNYYNSFKRKPGIKIGPTAWDRPYAGNLARIAHSQWRPEQITKLSTLSPCYLRKVEAEIRLEERLNANKNCSDETGRLK